MSLSFTVVSDEVKSDAADRAASREREKSVHSADTITNELGVSAAVDTRKMCMSSAVNHGGG